MADTMTVIEVTRLLAGAIEGAFPDEIWVRGQIRNLNRSAGGTVYFSLVEPTESGRSPDALLRVVLFPADRDAVNRLLRRHGAGRMDDGVEVRIQGRLGHHTGTGTTRLRMTRIDPEFTLGRLAAERERLIRTLAAEGLLDRNRTLPLAPVPLRVVLVTSAGSAASADFWTELDRSGFAWEVGLVDARVQGPAAAASISAALAGAANSGADVVALVRGGGARTDLAAFDAEQVARAIAACPVPVFTGIGHEGDESVADRVAHSAFKTPTACAAALVAVVAAYLDRVEATWERVASVAVASLDDASRALAAGARRLSAGVRVTLSVGDETLAFGRRRLMRAAGGALRRQEVRVAAGARRVAPVGRRLVRTRHDLDGLAARLRRASRLAVEHRMVHIDRMEAQVRVLDPSRLLSRGWSVTRDASGAVVRSAAAVGPGDVLVTTLADGRVTSRVEREPGEART